MILAVGGATSYFGQPTLEPDAIDLKASAGALELRDRILSQFELAAFETERSRRQRQATFVIAGGGPTGAECAGAISELIRLVLVRDFPDLDTEDVRVVLVEAGPSILDSFPPTLSQRAVALLRRKNVEVRLNAKVVSFDPQRVLLASGEPIPAETMVWAAAVQVATLIQKLDLSRSRQALADLAGRAHRAVDRIAQSPAGPDQLGLGLLSVRPRGAADFRAGCRRTKTDWRCRPTPPIQSSMLVTRSLVKLTFTKSHVLDMNTNSSASRSGFSAVSSRNGG